MNVKEIKNRFGYLLNQYYIPVVIGLVVIIVVAGYLLFIKEVVTDIRKAGTSDLQGLESELVIKEGTITKLKSLEASYHQLTPEQLKRLDDFIPSKAEIPFLVLEIQKFIESNNVTIKSIDTGSFTGTVGSGSGQAAVANAPQPLNITVALSGLDTYAAMKEFLDAMSKALPLLELHSLTYAPSSETYTLNLTTFYK